MSNMKCLFNHVPFHSKVFYQEEHCLLDQHIDSEYLGYSNAVHQDEMCDPYGLGGQTVG